jgi:hypothetical protein
VWRVPMRPRGRDQRGTSVSCTVIPGEKGIDREENDNRTIGEHIGQVKAPLEKKPTIISGTDRSASEGRLLRDVADRSKDVERLDRLRLHHFGGHLKEPHCMRR